MPISVSKYYVSDDMSGNIIYILPDNCPSCSPSFKPKRQHQDAIEEWRLRTCGGIATRVVAQIASARNWQALSGAGRLSIRSLMAPWFAIETNDEARYGLDAPVHRNRWSRGMAGPPRLSRRVISQARPAPGQGLSDLPNSSSAGGALWRGARRRDSAYHLQPATASKQLAPHRNQQWFTNALRSPCLTPGCSTERNASSGSLRPAREIRHRFLTMGGGCDPPLADSESVFRSPYAQLSCR